MPQRSHVTQRDYYFRVLKGVDLRDPPFEMSDLFLSEAENVEFFYPREVRARKGSAVWNTVASPTDLMKLDNVAVKSLFRHYPASGAPFCIATGGTKVYTSASDNVFDAAPITGLSSAKRARMIEWANKGLVGNRGRTYIANEADTIRFIDSDKTAGVLGGSPPKSNTIALWKNRLWVTKDTERRFSVYASDLAKDNVWNGLNQLNVTDAKGGLIQEIVGLSDVLLIFKTTGIWRFAGSLVTGGRLEEYSKIPCVAQFSVVATPFGVIFQGRENIYITDGVNVAAIADPIASLFDTAIPLTDSVAGWDATKNRYWISFDADGTGGNDTVWVGQYLPPVFQQMTGELFAWSKWVSGGAAVAFDSFAEIAPSETSDNILGGLTTGGIVRKLDTGTTDAGSAYTAKVVTKGYADPRYKKHVRWLSLYYQNPDAVLNYQIDYPIESLTEVGFNPAGKSGWQLLRHSFTDVGKLGAVFTIQVTSTDDNFRLASLLADVDLYPYDVR